MILKKTIRFTTVLTVALSCAAGSIALGDDFPSAPSNAGLMAKYKKSRRPELASEAKRLNRYYFLRPGDTPESVSQMIYGTEDHAKVLQAWVGGAEHWQPGRVLYYTSPTQPEDQKVVSFYESSNVATEVYTVKRGESLSEIAKKMYGDVKAWRELAWLNRVSEPDAIEPGDQIRLLPDQERLAEAGNSARNGTVVARMNDAAFAQTDAPARVGAADQGYTTGAGGAMAAGQSEASLSQGHSAKNEPVVPWTFPGVNISSPAGYTADWGTAFIGMAFESRARNTTLSDAAFGAGVGFGDARKYVAAELDIAVFSVHSMDRGALTGKVSRILPWYDIGVSLGYENFAKWNAGADTPSSVYGSVSKVFAFRYPSEWFSALTLTAGVGGGRFQSESALLAKRSGVGVFGSAAIRVLEPVSFIADWGGQDLALGLSIAPLRRWGLFINPAVVDLTRSAGDGARFIVGAGFAYNFNDSAG